MKTIQEIKEKSRDLYPVMACLSKEDNRHVHALALQKAFINGAKFAVLREEKFYLSTGDSCTITSNGDIFISNEDDVKSTLTTLRIQDIAIIKSVYERLQDF